MRSKASLLPTGLLISAAFVLSGCGSNSAEPQGADSQDSGAPPQAPDGAKSGSNEGVKISNRTYAEGNAQVKVSGFFSADGSQHLNLPASITSYFTPAVTGIDLTPEFCEAATALSEWTGLSGLTRFRVGDATATGLPDGAMDGALMVHVAMNIPAKPALYAEAFRVLRPGGRFVVYDVLQGEGGSVRYPVPWANDETTSFLATPDEMREMLAAAGFDLVSEADSSDAGLAWFRDVRDRISREGPPPVTFAAFLGDAFGQMAANQVANLAERRIRTVMFTCSKP